MKQNRIKMFYALLTVSLFVLVLAIIALFMGDVLDARFNVIGIRVATLLVAFASFISSTSFSFLVYTHNKTVNRINDDTNKRAESFRNFQFSASNYSIIEFMDRMLIYLESPRYIERFILKKIAEFHMFESSIKEEEVYQNPTNYTYLSIKIPFKVVEGKMVGKIILNKIKFEREEKDYEFIKPDSLVESRAYILYNEYTKRHNIIMNLVVDKNSDIFDPKAINVFSKIKLSIQITSLLGVSVSGTSELYFINPEQIEGDATNTYKINSSNFVIKEMPTITHSDFY
ncbi:MAG: hypothetical protein WCY22_00015 [Acholeplasmataceae bacterium]